MSPCSCGLITNDPVPIGIQYGAMDESGVWHWDWPALILWNCACGSTRAQRWADATTAQRQEAHLAELAKEAKSEMAMWGG